MIRILFITLFLILNIPLAAKAQITEGQKLDKIVAVVGDEIVMQSEIDGYIEALAQSQPDIKKDDPKIREMALNSLIDENLMVTKAKEDSITVQDEEVDQRVDFMIQQYVNYYGSEKRVEDVLGMSVAQLKRDYREVFKKRLLAEKLKQMKVASIEVSPKEVTEFFEAFKDSLPVIKPEVELYHIVKYIKADENARDKAYNLAKSIRDSLLAGADFAEMAKKYSDDPMTKNDGGELGWFDKGKLYPEFEKAAFKLQPGETSIPVETPFGFHIIQTLEKRPNAVLTRHILIKVGQTGEDKERVIKELKELKKRVENGEDFSELARKYSEDKDSKGFGGYLGKVQISELPPNWASIMKDLPEGGVTDPMPYNVDPTKPAYHIIMKNKMFKEHAANLKDDYKKIEQMALQNKQNKVIQDFIAKLRKELYWEIKK